MRVKRAVFVLAIILAAVTLASCVTDSFGMKYYETRDRMSEALDFEMRGIPADASGLERETGYGAQDGKLGEITYAVSTENGKTGLLRFRMATADYAEKYSEHASAPGIAGIKSGDPVKTERLGSAEISYYVTDGDVFAVWNANGYAFSASLRLDGGDESGYDEIYPFVLAVVAEKNGSQDE